MPYDRELGDRLRLSLGGTPGVSEKRLVQEAGARRFSIRGREIEGWLLVDAAVLGEDTALKSWIDRGVGCAGSLPPKEG